MKKFSTIWVLASLICCFSLSPKNYFAAIILLASFILSVRCARKHNPSMFV